MLALGNVIRMGAGVESIPVVSVAPSVGFVSPAYGGRKPITQVEWSAERLEPVEIAATLAIPDAFIDDSGFPVWESVRSELAKAVAKVLDQAVLFGTSAPPRFPAGGIAGLAGAAQTGTDTYTHVLMDERELDYEALIAELLNVQSTTAVLA